MDTETATTLPGEHELETIEQMPDREVNKLPFGAIRLDPGGKILRYNKHAADLTGLDPRRIIGRNFFDDVAPCTNVESFAGRYREGVKEGSLHAVFSYSFDWEMPKRVVGVVLFYKRRTRTGWVFFRES